MNPFDALLGNEKQKKYFENEICKGTLAHAFILEGEEGSGRHTLALAVAEAMAKKTLPEEEQALAQKISAGQCPDVKEYGLAGEKKIVTVETIRKMKSDAFIKPNDLPFKLFILSSAQCMNQQAQNAALKILEEPPENTYFFLLTTAASALLPTVRSRAPVIRMQRFTPGELAEFFERDAQAALKKREDPSFFEECLQASGGSLGRAKSLLLQKSDEEGKGRVRQILSALNLGQRAELLLLCHALPSSRQEFDGILASLQSAVRDALLARSGGKEAFFFFKDAVQAGMLTDRLGSESLLKIYDCLLLHRERLSKNVNIQNARMSLALGLYNATV